MQRRAVGRVLGEQPVQQRGAGARQAGDEQRPADRLLGDLGVPLPVALHLELVLQQAADVLSRGDPSEEAELRLVLERVQQPAQRLAEPVVAEVFEPCPPPRLVDQRVGVELDQRDAGPLEHATAGVEDARQGL